MGRAGWHKSHLKRLIRAKRWPSSDTRARKQLPPRSCVHCTQTAASWPCHLTCVTNSCRIIAMHNSILFFSHFVCQFTACTPLVRESLCCGRPMQNLLASVLVALFSVLPSRTLSPGLPLFPHFHLPTTHFLLAILLIPVFHLSPSLSLDVH